MHVDLFLFVQKIKIAQVRDKRLYIFNQNKMKNPTFVKYGFSTFTHVICILLWTQHLPRSRIWK